MRTAADAKASNRVAVAAIALGSVALAFASRMPSIWLDEASSIALARLPFDRLWSVLAEREANMGLYYVLLKGWSSFGDSLAAMRILSLVLGAASVVVMYLLGTLLFDRRTGVIAAALLGVNGMFVAFATEVRGYMLVLLLVLAATYWFARCVLRPSSWTYVAYAIAAGLAVYGHLFAGFVIASHAVSLLWLPKGERRPRQFVAAYAAILVVTAPMTTFAITNGGQVGWIGSTTPSDLAAAAVVVSGGLLAARARDMLHYAIGGLLTLLFAGSVVVALVTARRDRSSWSVQLAITCLALPAAIVLAVSLVGQPIWHYRYFVIAVPFAALLVARGIQSLRAPLAIALGAAICALSVVSNLTCYHGCEREDWVAATSFVIDRTQTEDAVAFYAPEVRTAFDYYAAGRGPEAVYPSKPWVSPDYAAAATLPTQTELVDLLDGHFRIWLVLSHDDIEGDAAGRRLATWIENEWGPPRVDRSFEEVTVLLFAEPLEGN